MSKTSSRRLARCGSDSLPSQPVAGLQPQATKSVDYKYPTHSYTRSENLCISVRDKNTLLPPQGRECIVSPHLLSSPIGDGKWTIPYWTDLKRTVTTSFLPLGEVPEGEGVCPLFTFLLVLVRSCAELNFFTAPSALRAMSSRRTEDCSRFPLPLPNKTFMYPLYSPKEWE